MTPAAKPIPLPDDESAPFFEAGGRGVLLLRRCDDCHAWLAPGADVCTECLSERLSWAEASGRGTIHTFGIMHQKTHPGFEGDIPYNVAVVELDEGPRLNASITGVADADITVGAPVVADFAQIAPGIHVPRFRPQ